MSADERDEPPCRADSLLRELTDEIKRLQAKVSAFDLARDGEHTLKLSEEQRQLVLMALALLSLARPGFDFALHAIAVQIDELEKEVAREGRPRRMRADLYDRFRSILESDWKGRPAGGSS